MPAQLSIGLTSGSLTALSAPTSREEIKRVRDVTSALQTDLHNNRYLRFTGAEKVDFSVRFEWKNKSDFDTIYAYCNTPQYYWVRLEDSTNTYIDGYYYLTVDIDSLYTRSPVAFYDSLDIKFIAK